MIPTHLGRALRGVLVAIDELNPDDKQRVLHAARNLVAFCTPSKPARASPAPRAAPRAPAPAPAPVPAQVCSVCKKPGHNARRHAIAQQPTIGAPA